MSDDMKPLNLKHLLVKVRGCYLCPHCGDYMTPHLLADTDSVITADAMIEHPYRSTFDGFILAGDPVSMDPTDVTTDAEPDAEEEIDPIVAIVLRPDAEPMSFEGVSEVTVESSGCLAIYGHRDGGQTVYAHVFAPNCWTSYEVLT